MKPRKVEVTTKKYVSFTTFQRPAPFRLLNPIENISLNRGKSLINMSPDYLIDMAVKKTGLSDWGVEKFYFPMKKLLNSCEKEAQLDLFGRFIFRAKVFGLLCNRLYIQDEINRHPEISNENIRKPLFIIGHPRTGTTMLHNLLSQDQSSRWLRHWEAISPSLNPKLSYKKIDPRITAAKRELWFMKRYFSEGLKVHPMNATGPEECHFVLGHSFIADATFEVCAYLPTYTTWLKEQDKTPTYQYYRNILQLLQNHKKADHWVLKSPDHLNNIESILSVFPDACIIQIHRDPLKVIPSSCSLMSIARSIYSQKIPLASIGNEIVELLCHWTQNAIKARRDCNDKQFFDLYYQDLIKDPKGTIRNIYSYFNYDYDKNLDQKIKKWLDVNSQHKHGIHRYSLEQFCLDPEKIKSRFDEYMKMFSIPIEQ